MIESGVPKENLALLAIPMVPIQILLPVYISRYTAGMLTFVHEGTLHCSEYCKFCTPLDKNQIIAARRLQS